jgi:hypothetical protein
MAFDYDDDIVSLSHLEEEDEGDLGIVDLNGDVPAEHRRPLNFEGRGKLFVRERAEALFDDDYEDDDDDGYDDKGELDFEPE